METNATQNLLLNTYDRKQLIQLSIFDIEGVDNEKETNNLKTLL